MCCNATCNIIKDKASKVNSKGKIKVIFKYSRKSTPRSAFLVISNKILAKYFSQFFVQIMKHLDFLLVFLDVLFFDQQNIVGI